MILTPTKTTTDPFDTPGGTDADFQNLAGLLSAYSAAQNDLAALQFDVDAKLQAAVESVRPAYTTLQERIGHLEGVIEAIVRRHPEWFAKRKSLVLPGGIVKLTSSTALEAINEELSLALLEPVLGKEMAANFLRLTANLKLDALETLDDAVLERLKIRRVTKENFKVEPARVNLGKAVADASRKAALAGKEGAQ